MNSQLSGKSRLLLMVSQWKEDVIRQYLNTDLIYNQSGEVFWVDDNGKAVKLIYKGYDKSCDSLRYNFHPSQAMTVFSA